MRLSVIIPCFNRADMIATQLEALSTQNYSGPWEVIISDNGSTDSLASVVEKYKERLPRLSIVDASSQPGAYHARNVGVRAARGDALLFCDSDDEVAPGWLSAMGEALSVHDFVACRIDFKKHNPAWAQEIFKGHEQQKQLQKAWYPPYLLHAGGGTLGVKKSLHEAVNGFDESLPHHGDTDYCFKMQLRGVRLHFVQDAVLHIRCRGTLGGLFHQARRWAFYYVVIYKRYRPPDYVEARARRWLSYAKRWKKLLKSLPQVCSKAGRAKWLWLCGWQIGLLQGSIMNRVPPL